MPVKDGPHCPACGLPNYDGLCPVCRGDREEFDREIEAVNYCTCSSCGCRIEILLNEGFLCGSCAEGCPQTKEWWATERDGGVR